MGYILLHFGSSLPFWYRGHVSATTYRRVWSSSPTNFSSALMDEESETKHLLLDSLDQPNEPKEHRQQSFRSL